MRKEQIKHDNYDLIVIGGGASGMMAAGHAASLGKSVLLVEKNKTLGEKLKITGGGRCNITNAIYNVREFLANYGAAAPFLFSPFSQFSVKNTFDFFESLGLPLVVQARNRAFPQTEKATDVVNALLKHMQAGKVTIKTNTAVQQILREAKSTENKITGIIAGGETYTAKSYLLATGGASHPETGSTGDGFNWLGELGHTVKPPTPTIVPLATSDQWSHMLSGVSLSFMKISFYAGTSTKKRFSKLGKILFTHFGLSGPLILNSSTKVADLLQEGPVTAKIDAYPDTDLGALNEHLVKIFNANKNRELKNVLKDITPEGTAPGIALLLKDIDMETKVHSITKEQRKKIVDTLKGLPVTITNLMGYDRAVMADGGVALSEIDTKTMRSKLYSNLFVTGDLLNIIRPSGGFSLQLCWTTGWVAGANA